MKGAIVLLSFLSVALVASAQNDVVKTWEVNSQVKICAAKMASDMTAVKNNSEAGVIACGENFANSLSGMRDLIVEFVDQLKENVVPELQAISIKCKSVDLPECINFYKDNDKFAIAQIDVIQMMDILNNAIIAGVACVKDTSKTANSEAAAIFKTVHECLAPSGIA